MTMIICVAESEETTHQRIQNTIEYLKKTGIHDVNILYEKKEEEKTVKVSEEKQKHEKLENK